MSSSPLLFPLDGGSNKVEMSSFKEKLIGKARVSPKQSRGDLFKKNLARVELEEGNWLLSKIFLDHSICEELSVPWKDALVVKLLGKEVGFLVMQDKLSKHWKLDGGFETIDLGYGYFLTKLDNEEDRTKVLEGGPWMLFDHYLSIRPWSLDFVACSAKIDSMLVWVRIPSLNVGYYDEDVLLSLASMVGKPVNIDLNTTNVAHGKFARVCVQIDLD